MSLNKPTRSTRGKRITPLTEEEIAKDAEFWAPLLAAEDDEEDDPDYEEEEKEEDLDDEDDIASSEEEDELSDASEDDIAIDKKKEKIQPKGYIDPSKKNKAAPKATKPATKKKHKDDDEEEDEEEAKDEEDKQESFLKVIERVSEVGRNEKKPAAATATATTPLSKKRKNRNAAKDELTQEELLEEAKLTEQINIESLNTMMQREEGKKRSHQIQDKDINEISRDLDTKIKLEEDRCRCGDDLENDKDMLDLQNVVDNHNNNDEDPVRKKTVRAEVNCSKCGCCKLVPLKIPLYGPYTIKGLKKGIKYEYCTCGLTKNQPFCDKSHLGTEFKPIPFTLDREQTLWMLCGCRYSQNIPFCDAEHTKIPFNPKDPPCRCDKSKQLEF